MLTVSLDVRTIGTNSRDEHLDSRNVTMAVPTVILLLEKRLLVPSSLSRVTTSSANENSCFSQISLIRELVVLSWQVKAKQLRIFDYRRPSRNCRWWNSLATRARAIRSAISSNCWGLIPIDARAMSSDNSPASGYESSSLPSGILGAMPIFYGGASAYLIYRVIIHVRKLRKLRNADWKIFCNDHLTVITIISWKKNLDWE